MAEFTISELTPQDEKGNAAADGLLARTGIRRDSNLDYRCAVLDEEQNTVATGGCFGKTLRCIAVSPESRGTSLLNTLLTHLVEVQFSRGNPHIFLYTKPDAAPYFRDLGFHEIAGCREAVFLENRRDGFRDYCAKLLAESGSNAAGEKAGAVVMNGNPFTRGHRHLIEQALKKCSLLHIFIVSEENGAIPAAVRKELIVEGTKDLPGIVCHDTADYMISQAVFPGYFLADGNDAARAQAHLDAAVFLRVAETLGIDTRFVGTEPYSVTTSLYNRVLLKDLPDAGISCVVVRRLTQDGRAVSASEARRLLAEDPLPLDRLEKILPETTLSFFRSSEGSRIREKLREDALQQAAAGEGPAEG